MGEKPRTQSTVTSGEPNIAAVGGVFRCSRHRTRNSTHPTFTRPVREFNPPKRRLITLLVGNVKL